MNRNGIRDGLAIGLGYLSVGFTFGIAAVGLGLTWWEATLISMTNITSAGQFAGITVIATAGSYIEMALTQLIINLRYALMGISLSQRMSPGFTTGKRFLLGHFTTDEIFAVAVSRDEEVTPSYYLGLAVLPYIGWSGGTMLGAILGNVLPPAVTDALGIAIYGMFIAIIVPPMLKSRKIAIVTLIAVAMSCVIYFVPSLSFISTGFAIIICTVAASLLGAIFFPVDEEGEANEESMGNEAASGNEESGVN